MFGCSIGKWLNLRRKKEMRTDRQERVKAPTTGRYDERRRKECQRAMTRIHNIPNSRQAIAAHCRDRASMQQTSPLGVKGKETARNMGYANQVKTTATKA